jgi:multisubunit Na+/H+ antiporter MnhB subunit
MEDVERIVIEPSERSLLTPKRRILIGWMAFSLLTGIVQVALIGVVGPDVSIVLILAETIGFGILILAWCKADSDERGEDLSSGWKFMLVFLGVLTLTAYLFKSRGFARGLLAVGYSLAFILGNFIFDYMIMIVLFLIRVAIFEAPLAMPHPRAR